MINMLKVYWGSIFFFPSGAKEETHNSRPNSNLSSDIEERVTWDVGYL